MAESEEIDLQVAFAKPGAKRRFRKLVGLKKTSDKEVEEIVSLNDDLVFLEYLQQAGQPVFDAGWGALHHGASGRFELYHFDGFFFAYLCTDWCKERAGPFRRPLEAADRFPYVFEFNHEGGHGISGAIRYGTNWNDSGSGRISTRMAEKIFETLTGHLRSPLSFYWCEAEPGKLFHDPFHDEGGKAVLSLHEARKDGTLDAIYAAELNLNTLTEGSREDDYVLGGEAKHFTSAFDSFLMKAPMDAKGKLARFSTEWVRICLPRRLGKKTLATVIRIKNPMSLVGKLVPLTGDDISNP
jgi:hypothetical protein